jgi:hypothetical protein
MNMNAATLLCVMVGLERLSVASASTTEAVLRLSRSFEAAQDTGAWVGLRQSAWERANPNAPWWRQFQPQHRRPV